MSDLLASIPLPPRILRDADMRPVVRSWAESCGSLTYHEEVCLSDNTYGGRPSTRLDFLLVHEDRLACVELKGDTDSLASRWVTQRIEWERTYEELWLVTTEALAKRVVRERPRVGSGENNWLPPWWGHLLVREQSGELRLEMVSPPGERADWVKLDLRRRVGAMHMTEIRRLYRAQGIEPPSREPHSPERIKMYEDCGISPPAPSVSKHDLVRAACKDLPSDYLHRHFVKRFRGARTEWAKGKTND